MRPTSVSETTPPSVSSEDQQFFVSFGLIVSARLADVARIREAVEHLGGKIAFQTVSNGDLYILRAYQLERALSGDISQLCEIHERKTGERRNEKI